MAREYFKVFHSYLRSIEPLDDAERGRLFTALLEYSITGETPVLTGNERFIFPTLQANIDRGMTEYQRVSEANSRNGRCKGRARKSEMSMDDDKKSEKSEKSEDKDKEQDKEQDKEKDKDNDYDKEEGDTRTARTPTRAERECVEAGGGEIRQKPAGKRGGRASKPFVPPTVEEVTAYVSQRGSRVDPQGFVDYYAANGWMLGRAPMRDWRAACRNAEHWERWERDAASHGARVRDAPAVAEEPGGQAGELLRLYERMKTQEDWVGGE